jgi:FAD/FMN-containing dehydrogenase/Fe-S oxidoreductase
MPSLNVLNPSDDDNARVAIARDLQSLITGEVLFDDHHRLLYSTDASLYQVKPIGVVLPADSDDVAKILGYCAVARIAVLPRGGGTSLAGQCTNRAVVIDFSRMCRRVLSIDATARTCVVEPGITIDELNRALLAETGNLMFAPDPATVAQACIGGCIGNNAAGARSIRYGRTSENVAALDVVLTTGERARLEHGAGGRDPVARRLALGVSEIVRRNAAGIRARFPKTIRRNAGYGLDLILAQLDRGIAPEDLDLSGLICGSEGTLAAVVQATLKLHPIPKFKGLAIASFGSLEASMDAVNPILATNPSAVELLDDVVLEAAAGNAECRNYLRWLPPIDGKSPAAVLYVEYSSATSSDEITESFTKLRATLCDVPLAAYVDSQPMADLWALRKAGEPLLHGLSGHRKPHTFVEDNAVPVENLPRFLQGFRRIVSKHGTRAAYYAHASVGVLHVRPLIDLHDERDRTTMRAIAVEVADLARECGGIMSGEHGDGRVRGPLLERFFGPALMRAFAEIKAVFDPAGILNPGMIVAPGAIETITANLRIDPIERGPNLDSIETYFDYSDQEAFRGALEQCNGAGVCRKTAGGTMCPSYRATLDERHSTRGRANALRTALTGQISHSQANGSPPVGVPVWNDPDTIATLDLCLSCKACKSECPSNVDLSRLKAEYTAQRFDREGATLSAKIFGHIRRLNQLASIAPDLANVINAQPFIRQIFNELLNLAPQRSIPEFAPSLYRQFHSNRHSALGIRHSPSVLLFGDCFTTYNEPHIGMAAIELLESLGYQVLLPRVGCCGRAMISTGLLPEAIASADATIAQLQPFVDDPNVRAILVAEPSCLSSFKDDWLRLKMKTPMPLRARLAEKSFLVEEFVEKFWANHPITPNVAKIDRAIVLHGHCHQKALWGDGTSGDLLRRLFSHVTALPSGCCGMAGSFGYTREHYDISVAIANRKLLPAVKAMQSGDVLAAPGTSCRHQVADLSGATAQHPAVLIRGLMK